MSESTSMAPIFHLINTTMKNKRETMMKETFTITIIARCRLLVNASTPTRTQPKEMRRVTRVLLMITFSASARTQRREQRKAPFTVSTAWLFQPCR
jgi:hypothetical protein